MRVFDKIIDDGIVLPYMPLWSHFQHTAFPRPYEDWIAYDNEMIASLDIKWILRLTAECGEYSESRSSGADAEVELVKKLFPDAIVIIQNEEDDLETVLMDLYSSL